MDFMFLGKSHRERGQAALQAKDEDLFPAPAQETLKNQQMPASPAFRSDTDRHSGTPTPPDERGTREVL
jgi:hypothetical protein